MTNKVIDTLKKVIDSQYHLPRQNGDWCLSNNVRIRPPTAIRLGFLWTMRIIPPFHL